MSLTMPNQPRSRSTIRGDRVTAENMIFMGVPEKNATLNTIFSGTSSFPYHKRLADNQNSMRYKNMEMTKQLAALRFNIGIEQAKRAELMKTLEEKQYSDAAEK